MHSGNVGREGGRDGRAHTHTHSPPRQTTPTPPRAPRSPRSPGSFERRRARARVSPRVARHSGAQQPPRRVLRAGFPGGGGGGLPGADAFDDCAQSEGARVEEAEVAVQDLPRHRAGRRVSVVSASGRCCVGGRRRRRARPEGAVREGAAGRRRTTTGREPMRRSSSCTMASSASSACRLP